MKKTLLSRRGAAIELAMIVLALLMVVSIVLLTMASIQYNNLKSDISGFESKIELYEITDFIINNPEIDYTNGHTLENGYVITLSEKTYTVKDGDNVVLTIVTDGSGNITSWK